MKDLDAPRIRQNISEGSDVHIRQRIDEADIVPVQEELLTTFERKRPFAAFKDAAVRGKEVIDARLGTVDLALCLGLTTTGEDAQRIELRRWAPVTLKGALYSAGKKFVNLLTAPPTAGDLGAAQQRDSLDEFRAKSQGYVGPPVTAGNLGVRPHAEKTGNSMVYLVGGAVVLGAAFLYLG